MLEDAVQDIIETGEVETIKETIKKFQFYPTPPDLAEYLVSLADIKDSDIVLEPSAGTGAILKLIPPAQHRTAIEIDESRYDLLNEYAEQVECMDFLEYKDEKYTKIVMNPPFSKSQDVKHILHAYSLLEDGGTLVSIASNGITFRE